jgi:hypothetical protein
MDWHRLFGLLLTDFFDGSPFGVDIEKDLSIQKQSIDIIIVRKRPGRFAGQFPDGLDDLVTYNLLTFKSHQEPLDDWAIKELIGHYVSYRKQVSPSTDTLLPETDFRLYAVCARYPQNLASRVPWEEVRQGVYHCRWGTDWIRVVVLRQLPQASHNAALHLFSAVPELVRFGQKNYRRRSADLSTLLLELFRKYQGEGVAMTYTMEQFRRDFAREHLKDLTPEERLKDLTPEERLKDLSVEEIIKGLPVEEVLRSLPPEKIAEFMRQHQSDPQSTPKKSPTGPKNRRKPKR